MLISPPVTTTWHTADTTPTRGLAPQGCPRLKTNVTSVAKEKAASWPCPLEQIIPIKLCGLWSAATSLQRETRVRESCPPILRAWQSGSLPDRPTPKWCLSASGDTEPCWLAYGLISSIWWLYPDLCRDWEGVPDVPADGLYLRWLVNRPQILRKFSLWMYIMTMVL